MENPQSTCQIFNANCLEKMKDIPDNSVDLIFNDLPYQQTSCKWDIAIDMDLYWKQVMRIKKLNTPIFFTTTTKFGVSLIQSAPKKCFFRYDLVWVKSAPAGFLCAKKMPMRKHEMVYVFYEKLPFYDLSSHQHKFIKHKENTAEESKAETYGKLKRCVGGQVGSYDPPLPVSVVKEELCKYDVNKNAYGGGKEGRIKISKDKKDHEAKYDPPLPVSVVKEEPQITNVDAKTLYGTIQTHQPANDDGTRSNYRGQTYDPPLPTTMLEIKSTRGKHSTEKPVALMSWIFKYYSKEGDVILDPTMGSGSTGVACKNMNRNFIGIEMDEEIFKVAEKRLS
jgi:DNA modification methylase